jgi:DNA-directed RNA polymerase alpha subunit
MILRLFNGARTKEAWNPDSPEFIDDWKPHECFLPCTSVHIVYRDRIHVDLDTGKMLDLHWDKDGYIPYDSVFYGDFAVGEETELTDDQIAEREKLSLPLTELNLSVRARKAAVRLGVKTVGDLVKLSAKDLMEARNFGLVSRDEVREQLIRIGLRLRDD